MRVGDKRPEIDVKRERQLESDMLKRQQYGGIEDSKYELTMQSILFLYYNTETTLLVGGQQR
jgi:hypothetical protein